MSTMIFNQLPSETKGSKLAPGSIAWLIRAITTIETWRQRQILRTQFAGLDAHILRDSGISEAQRFIEGNKPFWQA